MQLYDNAFSPFSFKVRSALYEKAVPFEKCEILRHDQREQLLAINPRGEVPALVDAGDAISDSKVICAYLEEKFPDPPLLPRAAAERARCRFLELKCDTDIDACVFVLALIKLPRPELAARVPDALPRVLSVLDAQYAFLAGALGSREWLVGDFSLADLALAPHLKSAQYLGHGPGPAHANLVAWLDRISKRPSVRQASREMAAAFKLAYEDSDSIFSPQRLHWRNDRIECALRCGLGPWLLEELATDRGFLSPLPASAART